MESIIYNDFSYVVSMNQIIQIRRERMSLHLRKVFQAGLILCLVLGVSQPFYSQGQSSNGHLIKDLKWRKV